MFKALKFSYKKSKILSKIRKASETKKFDAQSVLKNTLNNTIRGKTMSDKELYIEELLNLLSKDEATITLLSKYNLKFDDLRNMISILQINGAGRIIKGHYVAVSAIAFIDTLNVLCSSWNKDGFDIEDKSRQESNQIMAHQMLQSF